MADSANPPDDEQPHSFRLPDESGQPPVPGPGDPTPETKMPVDLAHVDPHLTVGRLRAPVGLAGQIAEPAGGAYDLMKLAAVATEMTIEGLAAGGLRLGDFQARAFTGSGHFGERFDDRWQDGCELAVMLLYAQAGRAVEYQEICSMPVAVRHRHNGLGSDSLPNRPTVRQLLTRSLAASDRHCPASLRPLATATKWDRTSMRWGEPLPRWAHDQEHTWPHTLAESVARTLDGQRRALRRLVKAYQERPEWFLGPFGADQLRPVISNLFLMPAIGCGPPVQAGRTYGEFLFPGRDPDVTAAFADIGARAVLACGPTDGRGELPLPRNGYGPIDLRAGLPRAVPLGITRLHGVQHFWSPDEQRIGRLVTDGQSVSAELWQVVGLGSELPLAVALVERHAQATWTRGCLERFARDCAPGLMKVYKPRQSNGMIDVLAVANAAIVDGDRWAQAHGEFTL